METGNPIVVGNSVRGNRNAAGRRGISGRVVSDARNSGRIQYWRWGKPGWSNGSDGKPEDKPAYVTRKAPFWVYDCLEKEKMDAFVQRMGELLSICACSKAGLKPGNHTVYITAQTIEGEYRCKITVRVYDVSIPEHTFFVTNWFSEDEICRFHHVEKELRHTYRCFKSMQRQCVECIRMYFHPVG